MQSSTSLAARAPSSLATLCLETSCFPTACLPASSLAASSLPTACHAASSLAASSLAASSLAASSRSAAPSLVRTGRAGRGDAAVRARERAAAGDAHRPPLRTRLLPIAKATGDADVLPSPRDALVPRRQLRAGRRRMVDRLPHLPPDATFVALGTWTHPRSSEFDLAPADAAYKPLRPGGVRWA